jgi:hypothetical protein
MRCGLHVTALIGVAALIGCGGNTGVTTTPPSPPPTVEEYARAEVEKIDRQIPTSAELKRQIEATHPGVTYRGGSVRSLRVLTLDGSRSAGHGGSNVSEVTLDLHLAWEGPFTRDGFTEFQIVYNVRAKRVVETKYLRSKAYINLDTVDWFKVGFAIGMML